MNVPNGQPPTLLLRPSFLDVVAACPSAAVESAGKVEAGNEYTARGQAIHAGIQRAWDAGHTFGSPPTDDRIVAELSREYGIDLDNAETVASINFALEWLGKNMPRAQCEVQVGPGTVDALQVDIDEATFEPIRVKIVDWKGKAFGRDEPDAMYQQIDYAVAVADKYGVDEVHSSIVYHAQEAESATVVYDKAALDAARAELKRVKDRAREQATLPVDRRTYRDGDWCSRCKGASTCPALVTQGQKIGAMLVAISGGQIVTLDENTIPRTKAAVGRVKKAIEDFDELVLRGLQARGGESYKDETGEVRLMQNKLPAPKPKYEALLEAVTKRDPALAAELDREVAGSLPASSGMGSPFARLFPAKATKKLKEKA